MYDFEAVIPVYNPDKRLYMVIDRLLRQEVEPSKVNIFLTLTDKYSELDFIKGLRANNIYDKRVSVYTLKRSEFNHGGTRQKAGNICEASYCLYMTQDAVPANRYLSLRMLKEFNKQRVAVTYARQLPYKNAALKERYARSYNYPEKPEIRDRSLIEQGKIKAIFCSDVCAMYDMHTFRELGGFETNVDFNEDMLYAYKALMNDYLISYASKALVYHSHNLSFTEQFARNKALAISQKEHPEVFGRLKSEEEGISFVKNGISYMLKNGCPIDAISFILDCTFRFAGYRVGKLPFNHRNG